MTTKERVLKLISDSGKDDVAIIKEVGFKSPSTISDWRNKPSNVAADSIFKIAQYFNVSTDYLLGLTDVETRVPDAVLRLWSKLDDDIQRGYILKVIEREVNNLLSVPAQKDDEIKKSL